MFIRQKGKYKEAKANWIILMNVHMVCFWVLFVVYFLLPNDMKRPLLIAMGALIISFAVQVFGFMIKPDFFKVKPTKGTIDHG